MNDQPGDRGGDEPMKTNPAPRRRGVLLDAAGRCAHYHGGRDVVLNRCGTCGDYFACHLCHEELCAHPFGRLELDDPTAVWCGACGHTMRHADYANTAGPGGGPACPHCGHAFNPGCTVHEHFYWNIGD